MDNWKETIARIREVKMDLSSLDPADGPRGRASARRSTAGHLDGGAPYSPPSPSQLPGVLPRARRLAALLSRREPARNARAQQTELRRLTRAAFDAYETPMPEIGPPSRPEGRPDAMIPFGIDPNATTIFAFNPAVVRPDGEMEVIVWVNELGDRADSFADFLTTVLEMLEARQPAEQPGCNARLKRAAAP